MRRNALLGSTLAALVIILAPGLRPWDNARADDQCAVNLADGAPPDAEEQAALDGINADRARVGLPPVALSPALTRAARWKSAQMAGGAPFAHDDPTRAWYERIRDCGYTSRAYLSENLAAGMAAGAEAVGAWENSALHRANMRAPEARAAGIARASGDEMGWYWVVDFGGSAEDNPASTR